MKKWLFVLAPLLFICDILLKQFVIAHASQILSGDFVFHLHLLPFVDFNLTYIENKGMAWGMFASLQMLILIVRCLVIGTLSVMLIKSRSFRENALAVLFIILGAAGNVLDTLIYGHVVDMLSFTFWGRSYGIFNIADAMIFTGALMILFSKKSAYVEG